MPDRAAEARLDLALVARARDAGDRAAFEHLVRRHQGMVRAQLRRLLDGDRAMADDLAQEAFVLAWRRLEQFRGAARFSTWLYRIAYTCFLQQCRRQGPVAPDPEHEPTAAPEPADLRLDLESALRRLSNAEQEVLLHCVQMELSQEETAYVLGMPLGTVKTHATRGKARLRALLADWREHDG